MPYLIGLFIILAVIFSSTSGGNIFSNLLGQVKDKISATIFPKTEREIIIDNLTSSNQYLDKFFSETAPTILNSKNVSENDKTAIKKAVETFNNSKELITDLSKIEKEEKGPLKIVETLVAKVFNLNTDSSKTPTNPTNSINLSNSDSSTPTSIPPQCKLVCPSN